MQKNENSREFVLPVCSTAALQMSGSGCIYPDCDRCPDTAALQHCRLLLHAPVPADIPFHLLKEWRLQIYCTCELSTYYRLSIDCILEFYNNSMQILVSNHNPMIFHKSVPPTPTLKSVLRPPPTPEIVLSRLLMAVVNQLTHITNYSDVRF